MFYNDKLKLDNDLLPYLGEKHIAQVDYNLVDTFIAELHADKGLSQSSLKKYVVLVRKVLKEAERDGLLITSLLFRPSNAQRTLDLGLVPSNTLYYSRPAVT